MFTAAAKVVGEHGYSNAQVAMITAQASVAQGTFYNYFESQQDLLDQLLPTIGQAMLAFIKDASSDAHSEIEREEKSFRAFFEFLKINPDFYRILYEAEVFAPEAYQRHNESVARGYVRVLERALDRGELKVADKRELEAIAQMLMGARHYLCMRFARRGKGSISLPEWVVDAYMTVVKGGIYR
ncbi:TetR/AcrR family transcriptional regulator [Microvirga pudoricolor]|uniref:TetR/AcrR family transcriptional regulator n=1 Tax=Microvirga pudoricolor TaxID=2778729 RepID=UPI001951D82B|nr:TetR/AcrR family transcriptional regulator [Microvirga pudoricolor]MBM6594859.1 TetR/AcrR family transcriptional regulator [Microvirga pudoricolor]